MLRVETLSQVIFQAEAEKQEKSKLEPPRQYGIHLDSRLTIQTRCRYTSTEPTNVEELRAEYRVMSNL